MTWSPAIQYPMDGGRFFYNKIARDSAGTPALGIFFRILICAPYKGNTHYLQGKASIRNSLLANEVGDDRQQFSIAITLLEQATRMDSSFALAYCQIAKADDWLYLENLDH